jgi:hypothetical protein
VLDHAVDIFTEAALSSLDVSTTLLQRELVRLTHRLGFRRQDSLATGVAHCSLQLLGNLLHAVHFARTIPLSAAHALAFLRCSRTLLALVPVGARELLVKESVKALASNAVGHVVIPRSACTEHVEEKVAGDSDDIFSGAEWYLPKLPALGKVACERHTTGGAGANAMDVDGHASRDVERVPMQHSAAKGDALVSNTIVLPAVLVSPQLLLHLASAVLASPGSSRANGGAAPSGVSAVPCLLAPANELALWIVMLIATSGSDDLGRQQLEIAWTSSALGLVTMLWSQVLAPSMSATSVVEDAGELAGVPSWVLPLTVLCILYSHFVTTASNDAIFSNEVFSMADFRSNQGACTCTNVPAPLNPVLLSSCAVRVSLCRP